MPWAPRTSAPEAVHPPRGVESPNLEFDLVELESPEGRSEGPCGG